MEQQLDFLSFLSKDRLASHRKSFTFLGSGGPWKSTTPDGWRLCRWTAVQQPHLAPIPLFHSTIQLESRPDFNETPAMWFRSFWHSTGMGFPNIFCYRWPMYWGWKIPVNLIAANADTLHILVSDFDLFPQAEQKLNQVIAVCRLAGWMSVDLKSETCCWKLLGSY